MDSCLLVFASEAQSEFTIQNENSFLHFHKAKWKQFGLFSGNIYPCLVMFNFSNVVFILIQVVCYYTNWAWYRPGIGKYKPEDIDPTICTHVVYGFAVLGSNGLIKPHDSWADLDNEFYKKVTALKRYVIKESDKIARMIACLRGDKGSWVQALL